MIAVLALALPGVARAQQPEAAEAGEKGEGETLSLEWSLGEGAEGCPTQQALIASVSERMPDIRIVAPDQAVRRLTGHVEPAPGGGWRVQFQSRAQDGSDLGNRLLHADEKDCKDIQVAVTLIATLLAEAPEPPPTPTPLPPPKTTTTAALEPTEAEIAKPAPAPPIVWDLFGGVAGSSGLLPSFGLGPSVGASLRNDWPIALSMRVDLLPEQDLLGESPQARFTAGHARFGGCPQLLNGGPVELEACAGLLGGVIRGRGTDVDDPTDDTQNLLAGWADLRGHVAVGGPVIVSATVGVDVPFLRPNYGVLTPDEFETRQVHEVGAALVTSTLAVGARFGD